MRTLVLLVAVAIVGVVVAAARIPEGEVAELVTFDRNGRAIETDLWIVELGGKAWVRAPGADASWLQRVRDNPTAHLVRDEGLVSVRTVSSEDPAVRRAVNRAMQARYGRLERAYSWFRDPERTVPVQLVPISSEAPGA